MGMFRLMGLLTIIPATLLLVVSFFVLYILRKIETQGLKAFGYVLAALLWLSALLVSSVGIYTLSTGRHPMMYMMQEMMGGKMHKMMGNKEAGMPQYRQGMRGHMPSMMPGEKQDLKK